ncbi:MAG: replication initiation factor domain-containing protein [Methylococcaceae bacterium]|nr:replication initiation factor domain-containing protein [Methylococcaceae bacterium]
MEKIDDVLDIPLSPVADRDCNTDPLITDHSKKKIALLSDPHTTKNDKNYTLKIDWLEFTLHEVPAVDVVQGYLNLPFDQFQLESYSLQGFEALWTYGTIKVLESPTRKNAPVKIILSSRALDQINRDALDLINVAYRDKAIFSRIDIAMDCHTDLLDMQTIGDAIRNGQSIHRFRIISPRQDLNSNLEVISDSWTFGSAKGKRMIVIYDKRLERLRRGKEDPGHWIRIEGRWRSSTAKIAARTIIERGLDAGYLLGIIDFREKDNLNETRKTRCTWWETFLGNCEPIRTGERKTPSTIKKKVDWVRDQICTTIAQVFVSEGLSFIKSVISEGIRRTDRKEWIRLFGPRMDSGYLSSLLAI